MNSLKTKLQKDWYVKGKVNNMNQVQMKNWEMGIWNVN